jgi:hypothetical protein
MSTFVAPKPLRDSYLLCGVFLSEFKTGPRSCQGKTEELGEKPALVPLCPPQIPHRSTPARTRASAVRGQRLTAWAMARLWAGIKYRNLFLFLNFIPALINIYYNHLSFFSILWRYILFSLLRNIPSSYGSTAQFGPWPPLMGVRNNKFFTGLDC